MTFREKLAQEHPDCVTKTAPGGCKDCPHTYGYESEEESPCRAMGTCRECWDREMPSDEPTAQNRKSCRDCRFRFRSLDFFPCSVCEHGSYWREEPVNHVDIDVIRKKPMTPEEQERHDLKINAEIIRGYCEFPHKTKACDHCPAHDPCFEMHGNAFAARANEYNPEKQRKMLDAFEAALPPEDDAPAEAAPQEIPQEVLDLVEARIRRLTDLVKVTDEQIKAMEAERDVLCDFLNTTGGRE